MTTEPQSSRGNPIIISSVVCCDPPKIPLPTGLPANDVLPLAYCQVTIPLDDAFRALVVGLGAPYGSCLFHPASMSSRTLQALFLYQPPKSPPT